MCVVVIKNHVFGIRLEYTLWIFDDNYDFFSKSFTARAMHRPRTMFKNDPKSLI